jgi:hypothetical protein
VPCTARRANEEAGKQQIVKQYRIRGFLLDGLKQIVKEYLMLNL